MSLASLLPAPKRAAGMNNGGTGTRMGPGNDETGTLTTRATAKHSSTERLNRALSKVGQSEALERPRQARLGSYWERHGGSKGTLNNMTMPSSSSLELQDDEFDDGGAYPELQGAADQYPGGMGRKGTHGKAVVPLTLSNTGRLQYEVLAKQGHHSDTIVYAEPHHQRGRDIGQEERFARPSEAEVAADTETTRQAIERLVQVRVASCKPKAIQTTKPEDTTFLRYVSHRTTNTAAAASGQDAPVERIIKMVTQQEDPLQPARFKHKKVPRPQGSPPPPVLHSPPRRATAEEQRAWTIPPSISNWKNAKGYTIPLDKRLASDGRGLQERVMNERFAHFAEALYIAEDFARQEVQSRVLLEQQLLARERRLKEDALRGLAADARRERAQILREAPRRDSLQAESADVQGLEEAEEEEEPQGTCEEAPVDVKDHTGEGSLVDQEAAPSERLSRVSNLTSHLHFSSSFEERERIRRERAKVRERELRLSRMGAERRAALARTSLTGASADSPQLLVNRDISEKIALGLDASSLASTTAARSQEAAIFDVRLFNRDQGLASGFHAGQDDRYDVYDKPLFQGSSAANLLYNQRLVRSGDLHAADALLDVPGHPDDVVVQDTVKRVKTFFVGSQDPDGSNNNLNLNKSAFTHSNTAVARSGPIEFERLETSHVNAGLVATSADPTRSEKVDLPPPNTSVPSALNSAPSSASDPFGLDQFLQEAKLGKRK